MVVTVNEVDQPFRVVLAGGKNSDMLSGHSTEDAAVARCEKANTAAEKLNIKARYEARAYYMVESEERVSERLGMRLRKVK